MELPIFGDNLRSSAAWSVALEREREAWRRAQAPAEARTQHEVELRAEQVWHAAQRAGREVDQARVAQLAASALEESNIARVSADERAAAYLLGAARLVSAWAAEPEAALTVERLIALYRTLSGAQTEENVFRQMEIEPLSRGHNPAPAILLPRLLENACSWFTAPSFAEIHVVEEAALVYLRLLDLQPFATDQEQTALLAASLYTERAGWPPLIIYSDEATTARYAAAIDAAFRMLTQPLVEFFAESLARTIKQITGTSR
jgi:hypothetical protein